MKLGYGYSTHFFLGGLNMLLFGVAGNWNYFLGLIENLPYFCFWVIKLTRHNYFK